MGSWVVRFKVCILFAFFLYSFKYFITNFRLNVTFINIKYFIKATRDMKTQGKRFINTFGLTF